MASWKTILLKAMHFSFLLYAIESQRQDVLTYIRTSDMIWVSISQNIFSVLTFYNSFSMNKESRTAKSLKNSSVALAFYFVNLVLQFFSRKIFLDYLGAEVLGLNTTATNLLQFLNLAELGIGSAVGFSLYKPFYDKDTQTINELLKYTKHLWGEKTKNKQRHSQLQFISVCVPAFAEEKPSAFRRTARKRILLRPI